MHGVTRIPRDLHQCLRWPSSPDARLCCPTVSATRGAKAPEPSETRSHLNLMPSSPCHVCILFQLLNPMQSRKNFLESLDYFVFFFLLISQMSSVKSSSTNLGSRWAVTPPHLLANELLADGMVRSNCQHVTTKDHLETESGWPIDKSTQDCPDWSLRAHQKWHHFLGWARNYVTLKKAGWESEEVSWTHLFLSAVDCGGDLISCFIFHLDFFYSRL